MKVAVGYLAALLCSGQVAVAREPQKHRFLREKADVGEEQRHGNDPVKALGCKSAGEFCGSLGIQVSDCCGSKLACRGNVIMLCERIATALDTSGEKEDDKPSSEKVSSEGHLDREEAAWAEVEGPAATAPRAEDAEDDEDENPADTDPEDRRPRQWQPGCVAEGDMCGTMGVAIGECCAGTMCTGNMMMKCVRGVQTYEEEGEGDYAAAAAAGAEEGLADDPVAEPPAAPAPSPGDGNGNIGLNKGLADDPSTTAQPLPSSTPSSGDRNIVPFQAALDEETSEDVDEESAPMPDENGVGSETDEPTEDEEEEDVDEDGEAAAEP